MNYLLKITLIGLISGLAGTTAGGIIGVSFKNITNRYYGFIIEFAAGLMTAVVCFKLIPEALSLSGIIAAFSGLFAGIIIIMVIEEYMNSSGLIKNQKNNSSFLRTGILMAIGIALHNFPEGFAVGSGFQASINLGTTITAVIIIHDIPEGIAMSLPMRSGGFSKTKTLIYTILSGLPMSIGALTGALLGGISDYFIGICLGFAAGAMLYIIYVDLVPESKKNYLGRLSSIGNLIGLVCGIIISII